MATPSSPALKRAKATRGPHNVAGSSTSPRRGRRGSAVTFDETTIYPLSNPSLNRENSLPVSDQHQVGSLRQDQEEEDEQGGSDSCYVCSTFMEKHSVQKFFQVCAAINLLSLVFSAPLRVCDMPEKDTDGSCEAVFIQFVVIAAVDLILAFVYSVQLVMVVIGLCSRGYQRKVTYIMVHTCIHACICTYIHTCRNMHVQANVEVFVFRPHLLWTGWKRTCPFRLTATAEAA